MRHHSAQCHILADNTHAKESIIILIIIIMIIVIIITIIIITIIAAIVTMNALCK